MHAVRLKIFLNLYFSLQNYSKMNVNIEVFVYALIFLFWAAYLYIYLYTIFLMKFNIMSNLTRAYTQYFFF